MELLEAQCAIVTGGTAGIGKEIGLLLAKNGARVALFGTNEERAQLTLAYIREQVPQADVHFIKVDVSKTKEVGEAIKEVLVRFGQVDILVNNAGITKDQLLMRMSEQDWDDVMDINIKSCYNTSHALVRSMMKARKGVIINISSVVGLMGNAGQANYAASKAAMIGFSKSLAKELASRNIRVNCVCPGYIQTSMTEALTEEQKNNIQSKIPLGRIGLPSDVAQLVLFLVSPLSAYITGQVLTVDGGMVM